MANLEKIIAAAINPSSKHLSRPPPPLRAPLQSVNYPPSANPDHTDTVAIDAAAKKYGGVAPGQGVCGKADCLPDGSNGKRKSQGLCTCWE